MTTMRLRNLLPNIRMNGAKITWKDGSKIFLSLQNKIKSNTRM
jgi:hypothetical protein